MTPHQFVFLARNIHDASAILLTQARLATSSAGDRSPDDEKNAQADETKPFADETIAPDDETNDAPGENFYRSDEKRERLTSVNSCASIPVNDPYTQWMFWMRELFTIATILASGACATYDAALPPIPGDAPSPKASITYSGGAFFIVSEGADERVKS